VGRFINADALIGSSKNLLGMNTFVYCGNDAINNIDPAGTDWWHWAVAVTVVAALVVASVVTCGGVTLAAVTASAIATGTCTTVSATATIVTGAAMGAAAGLAIGVMEADISSADGFSASGEQALTNTLSGAFTGAANELFLCFAAGTLVLTEDGEVPIEDIRVGTLVWSWNEETGEIQLQPVLETYISETNELVHISAGREEIICTPNHPFYSPVKGWTEAVRLRAGDVLQTINGEYVVVEWVRHEILEHSVEVYNFQVEINHNYYITSGILVHNSCNHDGKWNNERRSYWRREAKLLWKVITTALIKQQLKI